MLVEIKSNTVKSVDLKSKLLKVAISNTFSKYLKKGANYFTNKSINFINY